MPKHSNDNGRERIVIIENGADLTPDVVVRETLPAFDAYEMWAHRFAHVTGRYPCVLVDMPGAAAMRRRAA